jgi:uncharacterized ferritin-like protein (DUF455 family)
VTAQIGLVAGAVAVLTSPAPADKVALTRSLAESWRSGALPIGDGARPPPRPARPEKPELLPPSAMPKRRPGGARASRVALLHALAHIELNAIDLAWDLIARFGQDRPRAFHDDWIGVAEQEAGHFALLAARLAALEARYGDLPAHDGLWQAAEATADDLLARLAIVPLVLEARGLDVAPAMIASLERAGDRTSAEVLQIIYRDEIGHVGLGRLWFERICAERGCDPEPSYHDLVRRRFKGKLKLPFNDAARAAAGLKASFYQPLAAGEVAPLG